MAMALAPSTTAASPDSPRAQTAKSGVCMATSSGATFIIGWMDGTRWLTLPMSVLPVTLARPPEGAGSRPSAVALAT